MYGKCKTWETEVMGHPKAKAEEQDDHIYDRTELIWGVKTARQKLSNNKRAGPDGTYDEHWKVRQDGAETIRRLADKCDK